VMRTLNEAGEVSCWARFSHGLLQAPLSLIGVMAAIARRVNQRYDRDYHGGYDVYNGCGGYRGCSGYGRYGACSGYGWSDH
jgi:hypothetical protein